MILNMKTQTAIQLAGSKAKLASLLGVSRAAVTQYKEILPPKRIDRLRLVHPEWFIDEPPQAENNFGEVVLTPV